jgi:hypothetical protein
LVKVVFPRCWRSLILTVAVASSQFFMVLDREGSDELMREEQFADDRHRQREVEADHLGQKSDSRFDLAEPIVHGLAARISATASETAARMSAGNPPLAV